jgi:hypothetical protein
LPKIINEGEEKENAKKGIRKIIKQRERLEDVREGKK